jgi:hypothetical protein
MADAIEVASRVRRWAITRGGEKDPLAERAAEIARRATGRLAVYAALDKGTAAVPRARAVPYAPADLHVLGPPSECPDTVGSLDERLDALDAEPPPVNGVTKPCWDAFTSDTVEAVEKGGDPEDLARLLLAVIERPHRQILAISLTDKLRERVALKPSGATRLPDDLAARRSARATVLAALLRAVHIGRASVAGAERLAAWIGVQRDGQGGYGSTLATRFVVRALLSEGPALEKTSRVTIRSGVVSRAIDVTPDAHVVVPLPADATKVAVSVEGPGIVARFERPVLRLWSHPPSDAASPLHVEALWPGEARATKSGKLVLRVRQTLGHTVTADLVVPLPPGVTLAEPVTDVRQVQGVLTIRRSIDAGDTSSVIEVPLRFALGGRLTAPEATAKVAFEEMPRAIAPARPFLIQ